MKIIQNKIDVIFVSKYMLYTYKHIIDIENWAVLVESINMNGEYLIVDTFDTKKYCSYLDKIGIPIFEKSSRFLYIADAYFNVVA